MTDQEMQIPSGITNEALWRKNCRKIRARALDFLEGRLGVIETARAMRPLAHWTKVENEPEFLLFNAVALATDDLPVGDVRAYWAPDALKREDRRIDAAEDFWREKIASATSRLVERYQWTAHRPLVPPETENC
ncbi:hypothetical protein [Pandoraea aquatica]|uniref:hypothetical protein n=1 Tax=Pandoraea aquatica TaxID=2508290 RepID=UPI001FE64265|nr:hypothetical protein [Pandoraea aquatica]